MNVLSTPPQGDPSGTPANEQPTVEPERPRTVTVDELLRQITPRAWVTPTLVAFILVGFVVEVALGASPFEPTGEALLKTGAEFGPEIAGGAWWRLLTSIFLHGGALHLAFNLWAFWSVGRFTERIFGNRSFLVIYLVSGIGGSLTSLALKPLTVSVGASGAIFGLYGALLAFAFLHKGVFPAEYLARQRSSIIGFLGYNVVFGLSQKDIDMAAHAGGFVVGALAGAALARDMLHPAEHAARRAWISAGFAALLVFAGIGVRARLLAVPAIRAERDASAAAEHYRAREYPQAIARYTAALASERDPAYLFNRGLAHFASEDLSAAREDLRAADRLQPTARTHGLLCEIGLRLGGTPEEIEEAIQHCTAAATPDEKVERRAELLAFRAVGRWMQERPEEALADADAALALNADETMARAQRAEVYLRNGKNAEAEADCVRLLASPTPRSFDLSLCIRVARATNDAATERARVEQLLSMDPDALDALARRAWLNEEAGRLAEALADYGKLLAKRPDFAWAWNNRGWIEVEQGEFAAARADADHAITLVEDDASYLGTRCFALAGLGEVAAARADCARAMALERSGYSEGMLAFLDGRYADARRAWEGEARGSAFRARELAPWFAKLPRRQ